MYIFLFLLLLLSVVDLPFLGQESGKLAFLLIGLYFWLIFRPSMLPYYLVFAAGLGLDFLSGGIVGIYTLCFMVMAMIVRNQRRFLLGQSWSVIWAGYCVAVTLITVLQYVVYSFVAMEFMPTVPVGINLVISYLLYPILLPLMMLFNRALVD